MSEEIRKQVSLSPDPGLWARFKLACDEEYRSYTGTVEMLIEGWLEQRQQKAAE